MKDQSVDYQELEFAIYPKSSEQRKSSFVSRLSRIWNQIIESIIAVNELKIYGSLGFHMQMFMVNVLRLLQKPESLVSLLKASALAY